MAGETGRARYAVKSAILTYGGVTYDMATGPTMKSQTREACEVTALSDGQKQFIPGALLEDDEFSVTLYDKGANNLTVSVTPAACSISVTLENGVADATTSVTYANCLITKVTAPSVDASGDRKATYDATIRPDGSAS